MNTVYQLIGLGSALALSACTVDLDDQAFGNSSEAIACETNDDCSPGLECEVEDAGSFCKPHGGDSGSGNSGNGGSGNSGNSGSGNSGSSGGAGGAPTDECSVDADCPAGEECELEHGVTFCKPHGGGGDDDGGTGTFECSTDADCPLGEECEIEPNGSWCEPHGGND